MKVVVWVSLLIIILSIGVSLFIYPSMPEVMASHWNTANQVDGYMTRFWGVFLMPIVSIAIFILFMVLPVIDPLKKNFEQFRKYYDGFIVMLLTFFFYIFCLSIIWNMGYEFNMGQAMLPALGLLFFYIGVMLKHAKRNWFVGIRTPWTMSSDEVWEKTHALGSKLFKVAGVLILLGFLFPDYVVWIILIAVLISVIYTIVYSYLYYRKLNK